MVHAGVMLRRLISQDITRSSKGFCQGLVYVSGDYQGEADYRLTTRENKKLSWPFHISEVNTALVAVAERVNKEGAVSSTARTWRPKKTLAICC